MDKGKSKGPSKTGKLPARKSITVRPFSPSVRSPSVRSPPVTPKKEPEDEESKRSQHLELFLGLVRDIRAETQNLQKSLSEIKKKTEITNKETRIKDLEAALKKGVDIFNFNTKDIEARFQSLRDLMNKDSELYNWAGDKITRIENLYQRASMDWPEPPEEGNPLDEGLILQEITSVDQLLSELIFDAGLITIPSRVDEYLHWVRIGQPFDFHKAFEDELPARDDRLKVLRHIHTQRVSVSGVVEVESGLIYKASENPWRRRKSYALIALVILTGAVLAYMIPDMLSLMNSEELLDPLVKAESDKLTEKELGTLATNSRSSIPAEERKDMTEEDLEARTQEIIREHLYGSLQVRFLMGYFFLMLGGILHIGVDAVKQARGSKERTFLALEDWSLWIHVKELSIITVIFSLWVGFLGLAFYLQTVEWYAAFLVGYSIDSFVDLFLQRFTATVSTGTEALKKHLEEEKA